MAKRFVKQKRGRGTLARLALPGLLFLCFAAFLWIGVGDLAGTSEAEQLRAVERAVRSSVVQCYAIEGFYPPGLGYLEEHYGLAVDREKYIVRYEIFAENIMPNVTVLPMDLSGWEDDENGF